MFNAIVKWYFSIPRIKFKPKNPFSVVKLDDREVEWFFQRREYGFDERAMWNLGSNLNYKIIEYLKLDHTNSFGEKRWVRLNQFIEWFKNDIAGVEWLYKRAHFYMVDYDCPTFWRLENEYVPAPDEERNKIKTELMKLLHADAHANDKDIEFIYDHIFDLGW